MRGDARCIGADDRPPAAREAVDEASGTTALVPAAPQTRVVAVCEAGTFRSCLITYIEGNRKNCFPSTQFCKANGFGWLPCGAPAEPPLPPPDVPEEGADGEQEEEAPFVE